MPTYEAWNSTSSKLKAFQMVASCLCELEGPGGRSLGNPSKDALAPASPLAARFAGLPSKRSAREKITWNCSDCCMHSHPGWLRPKVIEPAQTPASPQLILSLLHPRDEQRRQLPGTERVRDFSGLGGRRMGP
eukprot:4373268-Amphidinium_carterae.1